MTLVNKQTSPEGTSEPFSVLQVLATQSRKKLHRLDQFVEKNGFVTQAKVVCARLHMPDRSVCHT